MHVEEWGSGSAIVLLHGTPTSLVHSRAGAFSVTIPVRLFRHHVSPALRGALPLYFLATP
jgi:hypothetical protein